MLRDARRFEARCVILTVPLGVLQASVGGACAPPGPFASPPAVAAGAAAAISFAPPLPPETIASVRALGAGCLNKFIVEWEPTPAARAAFRALNRCTFLQFLDEPLPGGAAGAAAALPVAEQHLGGSGDVAAAAAACSDCPSPVCVFRPFPEALNWSRVTGGRTLRLVFFRYRRAMCGVV